MNNSAITSNARITTSTTTPLGQFAGGPLHLSICSLAGNNTFNSWAVAVDWSPDNTNWFPITATTASDGSQANISFTGKSTYVTAPLGRGFLRAITTGGVDGTGGVLIFCKVANQVQVRE